MRHAAISIVAGTVLSLAASGLSLAADMPLKAPPAPMAPSWTWTGFYIGGNVGGGWSADPTVTFTPNDPFSASAFGGFVSPPVSFNTSGPVGGFQVGYNWQFNQTWLVGIESDFDFSAIAGNGTSNNYAVGIALQQQRVDEKVQWFGTVRGRLGYLVTNSLLIYGTGGFAYGRVAETAQNSNTNGITSGGAPANLCGGNTVCWAGASAPVSTGWTAGGGLELALMNNWTVKAEYLYVSLGSNMFNENIGIGPSSMAAHFSDTNFHVARAGVNYKF
jgi:outer membrane immunogenic protein